MCDPVHPLPSIAFVVFPIFLPYLREYMEFHVTHPSSMIFWTFHSALGATSLDGKLYVCGGFDGLTSLDTVECYTKDTGR